MVIKDEFKFPDEIEDKKTNEVEFEIEGEGEVDIEIEDDTPVQDRGRKPLEKEVADPTDDEIESYSDKVKTRIKELTHARHDERRVKEATMREKQELERLAQQLIEENKRLKQNVYTGQEAIIEGAKSKAEAELAMARRKLKEAQEVLSNLKKNLETKGVTAVAGRTPTCEVCIHMNNYGKCTMDFP